MRALRFTGKLELQPDAPVPRREGEALVRVICAGICGTDLEITKGYSNHRGTLGHEFVGRVEESSRSELIGKRVVGEINAGCGKCSLCASGDSRHCGSRSVLGIKDREGAFGDYLALPDRNLLEVPDSISDDEAVFIEPLAAALHAVEQAEIRESSRVAVLGDGRLAQMFVRAAAQTGCDLACIGRHANKLELARAGGAQPQELSKLSEKFRSFDVVVDSTGSRDGVAIALSLVRPLGTVIVKSTHHESSSLPLTELVVNEVRLIGSRCGRFKPAIDLLERRSIDLSPLITARLSLDRGVEAFEIAAHAETMKVLLQVS